MIMIPASPAQPILTTNMIPDPIRKIGKAIELVK
jgi:hypothetical protein